MRKAWLIVVICMVSLSADVAADSLHIDSSSWESKAKDYDFSETVDQQEAAEQKEHSVSESSDWGRYFDFLGERWFRILFVSLAIGVIMFLVIMAIVRSKAAAKIDGEKVVAQTLDEAEDNLPDVELHQLLNNATAAGEWKVALRIHFLMLLQQLIHAELIRWRKRKTNREYIDEIREELVKSDYTKAVAVFDPVWYGTQTLDKTRFEDVRRVIQDLTQQLKDG